MDSSFEQQLQNANVLLQENKLEESIANYKDALLSAPTIAQKVHLYNVLGRLYQRTKNVKGAIGAFQESIRLYDSLPTEEILTDKASIFNNLAAVYLESDVPLAIENHKHALKIYTEVAEGGNTKFYIHLANTNFAMGQAYQKKNDPYFAKKHFKEAVRVYERIALQSSVPGLRASTHYQLGNIYTEEFNLFDAKVHYTKAMGLFQELTQKDGNDFKPFLAAVLNNLGVTNKGMGELLKAAEQYGKALTLYQELALLNKLLFLPYVAATFGSLGIVFQELKNFREAIEHNKKAIAIYNELADISPQEYTHYLATSLHNLGLFYFEIKEMEQATVHFKQALSIRKDLANREPQAFGADVCATALNLVELYRTQLENKLNVGFKTKSLSLLKDVNDRLQGYNDDRAVIQNMKNDAKYYRDYFNTITMEQLSLDAVLKKVDGLMEEINGTIEPLEKMAFQLKIVELLENLRENYPANEPLKNELAHAYNDTAWLHLRLSAYAKAEASILKALKLGLPIASLTCNLAHAHLLQGRYEKAKSLYLQLINKRNSENVSYGRVVLKDFEKLEADGIRNPDFDQIKNILAH